ncbi:hypothetical protein Hbl1158_02145 [Halobaculum sp. CBA1158]|uniref:DUF7856 family protein n=1 Tax=Halobaculum sp. CBA1158 TaxID=2904243 RepID=UPI001F4142EB|nr:hypothetical protein [Halobaculum sp. CBA1158]UIP00193.1 hypothetical protein Hbl1158_02145 [Halobaculum sp. CBA1158]
MRLRVGGRTYRGRSLDLRSRGVTVAEAVAALGVDPADPLATATPEPPPLRRSLAAAARERGHDHPADAAIRRTQRALASATDEVERLGDATAELADARERAAAAGADVERLRERAATLRGKLQAMDETDMTIEVNGENGANTGVDPIEGDARRADLESAFADATRALTVAETDRVAAAQALDRAEERARAVRDARERRLSLRDALANRRREARRDLAAALQPAFPAALDRIPGVDADAAGEGPSAFAGEAVAGHLAAIRLADRTAPVVVALDRFEGAASAATRLRAPVVLVRPA